MNLLAIQYGGYVYKSTSGRDSHVILFSSTTLIISLLIGGNTWTATTEYAGWLGVSSDSTGMNVAICESGGLIWTSTSGK